MTCEDISICQGELIQPLERDPIPVNKRVFASVQKAYPTIEITPLKTLHFVVEIMKPMAQITNEDPQVTQRKNDFVAILAGRKIKEAVS